ncbi:hypothetical protein MJT46_009822 [Ovis ammon polii x Ovis aries]|nr:hypothetical protein MJT46_009822 [Ovis ammon polii x Ovis aries]
MSGNFLSCSKGVKDPLEVPVVRCDQPRRASAEMGLISPGEQNLLDFPELRQVLSTYDGDLRDPLWWPQERPVPMCSRLTTGTSGTRSGGLRKGQSPWLSHVHTWWDSILGLNVKAVQGKQVPLEWTDTSGGLLEWWHDPGVPLAFPVESDTSSDATGTPGILSLRNRERIPHLELGGGIGAPLDVCRTFVLPLEWRRVCRELLELQQGCEGPFRSSSG